MNTVTPKSELKAAVQHLIQSGCNYVLEEFPKIYSPDLKIVIIDPSGEATALNYDQNFHFF